MKKSLLLMSLVVSIISYTSITFAAVTGISQPLTASQFPIKITKPGSYQLTSDITVPNANTTAILVQANNVTIDMNGFAILGPTVCSGAPVTSCVPTGTGIGIDASNSNNVRVSNGTISGMGNYGVHTGTSSDGGAIVQNILVSNNGGTGINSRLCTVSNCIANFNGGHGIIAGEGTASNNSISFNGGDGIHCDSALNVTGNYINANNGNGIWMLNSAHIANNTVINNNGDGIKVGNSGIVINNEVGGNLMDGISVAFSGMVNGNSSIGNTGLGLNLGGEVSYLNNSLSYNTGGNVSGGVNLGANLCDTAVCP